MRTSIDIFSVADITINRRTAFSKELGEYAIVEIIVTAIEGNKTVITLFDNDNSLPYLKTIKDAKCAQ